jgi:hypothetical protein
MPRPGPRREVVGTKFAPDEKEQLEAVALARGENVSDLVRKFMQPPTPLHEILTWPPEQILTKAAEIEEEHAARKANILKPELSPEDIWSDVWAHRLADAISTLGLDTKNAPRS